MWPTENGYAAYTLSAMYGSSYVQVLRQPYTMPLEVKQVHNNKKHVWSLSCAKGCT